MLESNPDPDALVFQVIERRENSRVINKRGDFLKKVQVKLDPISHIRLILLYL